MRKYELTYIAKPDLDTSALTALIERINGFVTSEGGAVVQTTQWGLRQLAYPIRKYREGYYVFSVIELEATSLARIEQRLRLTEDIIRYLLVRADEREGAMPSAAGAWAPQKSPPRMPISRLLLQSRHRQKLLRKGRPPPLKTDRTSL